MFSEYAGLITQSGGQQHHAHPAMRKSNDCCAEQWADAIEIITNSVRMYVLRTTVIIAQRTCLHGDPACNDVRT